MHRILVKLFVIVVSSQCCIIIYIIVVNSALDFNLSHVRLVHAQGTELKEVGAQQRFREEARCVVLSANEFDTGLAALGIVTMLEESNIEVLVSPRSFRIVRGEGASQVAAVNWRRRNEHSIRPMGLAAVRCDWGLLPLRSRQGTTRLVLTPT